MALENMTTNAYIHVTKSIFRKNTMLNHALKFVFGSKHDRDVKQLRPVIEKINAIGLDIAKLDDHLLAAKTNDFKERCKKGAGLDDIMAEAFAVVRETANRRMGIWQIFHEYLPQQYGAVREAVQKRAVPLNFDASRFSSDISSICDETIKKLRQGEDPKVIHLSAAFYNALKDWKKEDLSFQHRPFDVQLMGAIVLHQGKIAELKTGEGKTLMAVHTVYLNTLSGKSVHLVTPNDYLARRDAEWMSPIYDFLGVKVAALQNEMSERDRKEAYNGDIIYGTNNEFGFDYLRDNMKTNAEYLVQRDHSYAIVDEVDSILVDEARTPLIISGPSEESIDKYYKINKIIPRLVEDGKDDEGTYFDVRFRQDEKFRTPTEIFIKNDSGEYELDERVRYFLESDGTLDENKYGNLVKDGDKYIEDSTPRYIHSKKKGNVGKPIEIICGDYQIDEKSKSAHLTELGVRKVEKLLNIKNLYAPKNQDIVHHVSQALKAHKMFKIDVDYVVKEGKVLIVDEFTGRIKHGSRFSEGLHQALEAKENVTIEQENQTLGTITIQNYFRMYTKLSGMTGTADTEATEFKKIYKLDVVVIPTNLPIARIDYADRIYRTKGEKLDAIAEEVRRVHEIGQPLLIGTASIESSEELAKKLKKIGVKHSVLNAKYHEMEAQIIADAGQMGAVTIATNMAGRGTDIKLGPGVKEKGGLYILGTERHESRRIDNQLRGRSGRQGDPGCSRFYLSLEDDLMRIFGSDRLSNIMLKLGMEEGQEIEHPLVSRAIASAQKKVEGHNFDIRKHLLEYDEVMNKQREFIYKERNTFLKGDDETAHQTVLDFIPDVAGDALNTFIPEGTHPQDIPYQDIENYLLTEFGVEFSFSTDAIERGNLETYVEEIENAIRRDVDHKTKTHPKELVAELERFLVIQTIDERWKEHLLEMDHLKEGISMHWVAQKNPLTEYKFKGYKAFEEMIQQIKKEIISMLLRVEVSDTDQLHTNSMQEIEFLEAAHSDFNAYDYAREEMQTRAMRQAGMPLSDGEDVPALATAARSDKVSRNAPCPCGSGKKYKHCHGR